MLPLVGSSGNLGEEVGSGCAECKERWRPRAWQVGGVLGPLGRVGAGNAEGIAVSK